MSTEEKLSIFEALRSNIKLIGEDPSALENVEEGVCQLELKFTKYSKSMAEVLQVHSQMKSEIQNLKEKLSERNVEFMLAKGELEESRKLILRLRRETRRLKKRKKKSLSEKIETKVSSENDASSSHLVKDEINQEYNNVEGMPETV